MQVFPEPVEFEWDAGNKTKNWHLYGVSDTECEEVFFDQHKSVVNDTIHSGQERRYLILGSTKQGRKLFVVCTTRKHKVRIISARDLSKKERNLFK